MAKQKKPNAKLYKKIMASMDEAKEFHIFFSQIADEEMTKIIPDLADNIRNEIFKERDKFFDNFFTKELKKRIPKFGKQFKDEDLRDFQEEYAKANLNRQYDVSFTMTLTFSVLEFVINSYFGAKDFDQFHNKQQFISRLTLNFFQTMEEICKEYNIEAPVGMKVVKTEEDFEDLKEVMKIKKDSASMSETMQETLAEMREKGLKV